MTGYGKPSGGGKGGKMSAPPTPKPPKLPGGTKKK